MHSLKAKRVVMACPKHIGSRMLHQCDLIDPDKYNAMRGIQYNAYVTANVLIDARIERDFYDIFLLGAGRFPTNESEAEQHWRVMDVLNGHYARSSNRPTSVLTFYWPLPWPSARFPLLAWDPWQTYARRLAVQLDGILELLEVPRDAVRQVRITRWGHALPIAEPFFIANGAANHVRRPFEGIVHFVNQDNWALPAIENSLLDAAETAEQIASEL
jgi:hypothetical protein